MPSVGDSVTIWLLAIGGFLGVVLLTIWRSRMMRQRRRALALALIGEIVAILRTVETHSVIDELAQAAHAEAAELSKLEGFSLPRFSTYEANANKLDLLSGSLVRQIAYFYARMGVLADELKALVRPVITPERRKTGAKNLLPEIEDALSVGDEILRGLRRLIGPRRPASISRA
jgi:hypothetical protein